jgi:hypothetical protein
MDDLQSIIELFDSIPADYHEGIYTLEFTPTNKQKALLDKLCKFGCVEEINSQGKVIEIKEIGTNQSVKVEIVAFNLRQFEFYYDMEALVNGNLLSAPRDFYVHSLNCHYPASLENGCVNSYLSIISLVDCLTSLASYKSDEPSRSVYIIQDKIGAAIQLTYDNSLTEGPAPSLENIKNFVSSINEHTERKKIFTKELIDFLSQESDDSKKISYLFRNFDQFHIQYEAAYTFFLNDFSYSKLKLELESAILDYSKNIRAVINDSQTKLIAIPAAFLVASTQLDFSNSFSAKNLLIITTSYVFSILMEIFIINQESALKILEDNIKSYKTTFDLKNNDRAINLTTIKSIISNGFSAIDLELFNQSRRLELIRWINWGLSVSLTIITLGITIFETLEAYHNIFIGTSVIILIFRLIL